MENTSVISEANEESSHSNPEQEEHSSTTFIIGSLWNTVEKFQFRLSRVLHHRPLIYAVSATFFGFTCLPLVIFLLVVFGSFGFGVFLFAVLEGGIITVATVAFLISLIIPLLATLFITLTSYIAYSTIATLREFGWRFYEAPGLIFRLLFRKVNDMVGRSDKGHTIDDLSDIRQRVDAHWENPRQGRNDFGTTNTFRIRIVPARSRPTWSFSQEGFQDSRHRWSEVDFVEDDSQELGVAEAILLYMANFLRTLLSLLMVVFLLQVLLSKIQERFY